MMHLAAMELLAVLFFLLSKSQFPSDLIADPTFVLVILGHYPLKLQPENFFLQTRRLFLNCTRRAGSQR